MNRRILSTALATLATWATTPWIGRTALARGGAQLWPDITARDAEGAR